MSRRVLRIGLIGAVVGILSIGSYAIAGGGGKGSFKPVTLSGYEETPDISTTATGTFEAWIRGGGTSIAYKLTYSGLEGTVQQAHIHFGKPAVNGGISAFLCSNLPSPPAGTPACPESGSVEGVLDAADVIGPNAAPTPQGIEPGAFAELVAAMRAGHTYANVHSSKWPGGEIRAQIRGDLGRHGAHRD
jgi:hypothetical protein